MLKIGIITGSTREGRVNPQVAEWVYNIAKERTDTNFEIVDIKEYQLPQFEQAVPAIFSDDYSLPSVQKWAEKIDSLDGFIFITPEYNRGIPSALKSAIDYLYKEFNNKAAGIISYGSSGGVSAANALRLTLSTPKVAVVGTQPALNLFTDFKDGAIFTPAEFHTDTINTLLDDVILWASALKTVRN